jgi:hypothetical protein
MPAKSEKQRRFMGAELERKLARRAEPGLSRAEPLVASPAWPRGPLRDPATVALRLRCTAPSAPMLTPRAFLGLRAA